MSASALISQRYDEGMVPICENIAEWQCLALSQIQGMRISRPLNSERFQFAVDELAQSGRMGQGNAINVNVELRRLESLGGFRGIITEMLAPLRLPPDLTDIVQTDCCDIGEEMVRLLPDVQTLCVRLELLGESVCNRFHVDNYVGRAIVSYNCVATEYVEPSNVKWTELENCGATNQDILHKKDEVRHVDVGDVLFIMGAHFSPGKKGLVHKAPDPKYKDGNAIQRFCLKVDADRWDPDRSKLMMKQFFIAEDWGRDLEFIVEIFKKEGERIGLQVDETEGIQIRHVNEGGSIHKWNTKMSSENPALVVREGYNIISVNDVKGSDGMQLIGSSNRLRFKISRLFTAATARWIP